MHTLDWLAQQFEAERPSLRALAYRMLGSLPEAEDAVQEVWLHLSRSDTSAIANLRGWLTTVTARLCLNLLKSRKSRREDSLDESVEELTTTGEGEIDPEQETLLADSISQALLVIMDSLTPAERLAFVLHDIFEVPFDVIAPIVERSEPATRQLASRARRRVREATSGQDTDLAASREVVTAFLAAARDGDFAALLALLDPDVVLRADRAAVSIGAPGEVRGAASVAKQVAGRVRGLQQALINGVIGAVAQRGRQLLVFRFKITEGKIAGIDVLADPEHLRQLDLAILGSFRERA